MALMKDMETRSGDTANYHRISNVHVNATVSPAKALVLVMSYKTKAHWLAGRAPSHDDSYTFDFDPSLSVNAHTQCYGLLKSLAQFSDAVDDI